SFLGVDGKVVALARRFYDAVDQEWASVVERPPGNITEIAIVQLQPLLARAIEAKNYLKAKRIAHGMAVKTQEVEKLYASGPGTQTAGSLGNFSWHALFARAPAEALEASNRALTLAPDQTWIATNKAHALMFVGRAEEARAEYLAHRGKQLPQNGNKIWEE